MEIEKPHLFLEINEKNFIFLVVKYDEDFNFKVIYSHSIKSEGILDGKITNIESSSKIIKDCLNLAISEAIKFQRDMSEKEAIESQKTIEAEGHTIVELTAQEHTEFVESVVSQHEEARSQFGNTMFKMIGA